MAKKQEGEVQQQAMKQEVPVQQKREVEKEQESTRPTRAFMATADFRDRGGALFFDRHVLHDRLRRLHARAGMAAAVVARRGRRLTADRLVDRLPRLGFDPPRAVPRRAPLLANGWKSSA